MGEAAQSLQIKLLCNHKVKLRETNMLVVRIQGFGDSLEPSKHSVESLCRDHSFSSNTSPCSPLQSYHR
jgi:hypothetical protein